MRRVYSHNRKQVVSLTDKLGEGGEGTVFAWPSNPHRVCKIYHESVLQERGAILARKLAAMLASPPHDPMLDRGIPMFAWPQELLFDPTNHNRLVGFIMPHIRDSHSLHRLYSPNDRKQLTFPSDANGRPLPDYYVMVATARNVAEAFRLLHARGYVMADVNEDNIRFRTNASVALIDNDSFQVRDPKSGEAFLVPVMKAEYWPVDSLELYARGEALSSSHDQFGLALFLFRLLMNGVHPFHGMAAAGMDPPSSVENIAAGHFPFLSAHNGGLRPPLHTPAYDGLPSELRAMFDRCFVEGTRTPSTRADAGSWVKALDRAQETLQSCSQGHMYFAEAKVCPWCALEEARISCPKGHRYYREEGSCPQCRLEQRRSARRSVAKRQATVTVAILTPSALPAAPISTRKRASTGITVPLTAPIPPPQQTFVGTIKRFAIWCLIPKVLRRCLAVLLLTAFVGANVWGPLHLLDRFTGRFNPRPLKITSHGAINPNDGAQLILIPASECLIGSHDGVFPQPPVHKVMLDDFYIYRTPVTVEQYLKFCDETGHARPNAPSFNPNWSTRDHPIVNVSYNDALAYCAWAGVKLPTEAQWEKAASWDDLKKEKRPYPWGHVFDSSKLRCSKNVDGDAGGTSAVGNFPSGASPYGVLDMLGNVRQWCRDWYDGGFYSNPLATARNSENQSIGDKDYRILRGSSWAIAMPEEFRTAFRGGVYQKDVYNDVGFRCASGP